MMRAMTQDPDHPDRPAGPTGSTDGKTWRLRALAPGDLGWVVSRHGELYAAEYGWDLGFEALVAGIAARYIEQLEPRRENAWIAVRGSGSSNDGERLGCVFLVQARDQDGAVIEGAAQLRLLLVEPAARGLGLGRALVAQCSAFARAAGYRELRLWTNSGLLAARGIYRAEGYRLLRSEPHRSFGHDLVGEFWALDLRD